MKQPERELIDNHGRRIRSLRVAVTDRCNLRCRYCMPEKGIPLVPHDSILQYHEIERIVRLMVGLGITNVRLTGGEPFVRKEFITLIRMLRAIEGLEKLTITTNGTLTSAYIPALKTIGINCLNLSLDTLSPERFKLITRRDGFYKVWQTFENCLSADIPLKVNCVVLSGINTDELTDFVNLAREYPIDVRFIEEMPFNGGQGVVSDDWSAAQLVRWLKSSYPKLKAVDTEFDSTARLFTGPGFLGRIGVIAGYSRWFCNACSRLRITSEGHLQTCLYGSKVLHLREMMRNSASDIEITDAVLDRVDHRARDGFEAELQRSARSLPSMAAIGG